MAIERSRPGAGLLLTAPLLLWPAVWNGWPIVFADTGTYLSQAVHLYLGWDRPPFYSLAILPLHLTLSPWPVVVAQAALTGWVLMLTWRVLAADAPVWTSVVTGLILPVATWLPWLASEIMPDIFTPLLVLILGLLALAPDRLARWERVVLIALAALMIAAQTSSLALYGLLAVPVIVATQDRLRAGRIVGAPLLLAVMALLSVNLGGHRRLSLSPFGDLFLLARLLDDGPAVTVLRRECPSGGWRLCRFADRLPMNSDVFLWAAESPVRALGGHKALAGEAGAIVDATLRTEPAAVLRTAVRNTVAQLRQFASGDGLQAWPSQVTPWIEADFAASARAGYAAARQQSNRLSPPAWLTELHRHAALGGIALCVILLPAAFRRRPVAAFLLLALASLPVSAAVTGALSGPHDRYQARVMWLPPFVGLAALAGRVPRRA